ncbi:RiPP maturation radical SAM C-methyltransferase [Actinophytocola xanthii]|uniref:B12-binding domain-containing radical SAM protein n=1 Tax=Actinophytocola xanthii TaxID=1912961 RepID=A0A1Q8CPB4_9PSEU|nr:RiPP maturation radical SAM C-methyltransferase [Actinophytocola xanthii]OLF16190.1 B12-binding domain-containing radical SAM protein [Actinophytocola xanthii]
MRTVLVHMPWGAIDVPSLALGIMRTAALRHGHDAVIRYANLDFVDWLVDRADFGLADYRYYSESSYFQGAGDWVFAGALDEGLPRRPDSEARFLRLLADSGADEREVATTVALRALAPAFVAHLVDELVAQEPDVVGFTTTFQQNTASLAAARLLKRRLPGVRVVLGGANCDGPQGAALHRNFPFLDHVVRGEGEAAFPALLAALEQGSDDLSAVPGLCWRDAEGRPVANPMARTPLPPAAILPPDYDGFFSRVDDSAAATWVEPKLVIEGSRGCWWGEKHHCTFCGLNGSFMEFRSKSPDAFLGEVLDLARRHQLLDFFVVDNILDMAYFGSVLTALREADLDLRLHFEVKANLRRHQFQLLAESGVVQVQPGIENLSTHVLRLMDKGVTGCQNVRALRDAQSAGVTTSWNYLYGFPGESEEDYTSVLRQLPMLVHLDPPGGTSRIVIERFSPYFDRPELGFAELSPAPQYPDIYRLSEAELADLAYLFAAPSRGIGRELARELVAAIEEWTAQYPRCRCAFTDLGDRIVLVSDRPAYPWSALELTTPAELALFRLLDQPRTPATLAARVPGGEPVVADLLSRWERLGIVFSEGGHHLQVAVEARNQELMRVAHNHAVATEEEERRVVGVE